MFTDTINLTSTSSATAAIPVNHMRVASCQVAIRDGQSFGTARVDLQWSLDGETWMAFSPQRTLVTGTRGAIGIDVRGAGFLRGKCSQADGSADAAATFLLNLTQDHSHGES